MTGLRDTIYALSTAPGRSGVAVVRLSGPQAVDIITRITKLSVPPARRMAVRKLYSGADVIDEAMVVWFEKGASFTMEEMVEFHLHGGRATVSGILGLLSGLSGLRHAEPGEFTRRALESGRMDLLEVEALADLINAETEEQRKQAISLMTGDGYAKSREWRGTFLHALALLEASIDFADEEDAPDDVSAKVEALIGTLRSDLMEAIDGARVAAQVRDGFRVALVGAPNAGKSTLMNALSKRQAAITSPYAGTTRDVIDIACDFNGLPVILQDMAGLREATDPVEKMGVSRALETAANADLRIFLTCPDAPLTAAEGLMKEGDIQIQTKCDAYDTGSGLAVSALTGEGMASLVCRIVERLSHGGGTSAVFARERQIVCLKTALQHLEECGIAQESEIKAEHLRGGVTAMNHLFGIIGTEEILGQIFSQFCIGK